jgi:hypothetical protein
MNYREAFADELAKLSEAQRYKVKSMTKSPLTMQDPFEKFKRERAAAKTRNPTLQPGPWRARPKTDRPGSLSSETKAETL